MNVIKLMIVLVLFFTLCFCGNNAVQPIIEDPPTNTAPKIIDMNGNPGTINVCPDVTCGYGNQSVITCLAEDKEDGTYLKHNWQAFSQGSAGNISPKQSYASMAIFSAPTSGLYVITCTVKDKEGLADAMSVDIGVCNNCSPSITISKGYRLKQ